MGGRAHLRVDHSQPPDEPRLRVLGTDHGGTCLLVDDPINAQKAGQRNRMRASQTPSSTAPSTRMPLEEFAGCPRDTYCTQNPAVEAPPSSHPPGQNEQYS